MENGGTGATTGFGAISSPAAISALLERLRAAREAKGEPSKPGASSDTATASLGEGLNLFLTAGAESLRHGVNSFEDGYDSTVPTVTLGIDSQPLDWLTVGLAFNYRYQTGDYDSGGNFHNNSYGPLLYATFLPFEAAFANVTLGYARQNFSRTRFATVSGRRIRRRTWGTS